MNDDELQAAFWQWLERKHPGSVHLPDERDIAEAAWHACAAVVRAHDRDGERLNWLLKHISPTGLYSTLYPHWDMNDDTARAAIDAAMRAEG